MSRHGHGDTIYSGVGHTKEFIRFCANSFVGGVSAASGCSRSAWRRPPDWGPRPFREHPLGLEDKDREGRRIRVFAAVACGRDFDPDKLGDLHHQIHKLVIPAKARLASLGREFSQEGEGSLAPRLNVLECPEAGLELFPWALILAGMGWVGRTKEEAHYCPSRLLRVALLEGAEV